MSAYQKRTSGLQLVRERDGEPVERPYCTTSTTGGALYRRVVDCVLAGTGRGGEADDAWDWLGNIVT